MGYFEMRGVFKDRRSSLDSKHDNEEEKGGKDKDEAEKDPDRQSCQASRVRGRCLSKFCQNAVLGIDGWSAGHL